MVIEFFKNVSRIEKKTADHKSSWLQLLDTNIFQPFTNKSENSSKRISLKRAVFVLIARSRFQSHLNLFGMKNVNLRVPLIYTFRPKSVQLNSPYPSMANCKLFSHAFIIQTQPPKNRPAQYTALHSLYRPRTTDTLRGNSLHCMAENSIPIPNFKVRPKHILSTISAKIFRFLWFTYAFIGCP